MAADFLGIETPESAPEKLTTARLFFRALAEETARAQREYDRLTNRIMDIHGATAYLGMTESALRQKAGIKIPTVDMGGWKLWFDRLELDRWIDRRPRRGV